MAFAWQFEIKVPKGTFYCYSHKVRNAGSAIRAQTGYEDTLKVLLEAKLTVI